MAEKQLVTKPQRRWLRVVLVISLSLNILVVGLIGGAVLRGGPPAHLASERIISALGLRAYYRTLDSDSQDRLRDEIKAGKSQIKVNRTLFRAHLEALSKALKADPFEPDAVAQVLADQSGVVTGNIATGHELLMAQILEMSEEDRKSMAARLLETPKWRRPGVRPQK